MRVLIIDDETSLLRMLQRTLEESHEVETAESASVAFRKLAGQHFDVIVCDVHMPGMDGRAFVGRLSALDAARVVFTTGGAFAPGNAGSIAGHRVLMKPFTTCQLLEAMTAVARDAAGA